MTNICNFCLKLSNACIPVDETLKESINFIFINVEFVIAKCSWICNECVQRVHLAFELKKASISNEAFIVSHDTNTPSSEKLIDVYLEKNKMKGEFFPDLKICRFCITMVPDKHFYLLLDVEVDITTRELITTHFSEVDFTSTGKTLVCKICLRKLQDYGIFIKSWLDIYNLKKNYCVSNNKTNILDLYEVRKFIFETNLCPQPSDNFYINNIKNENDCLVDNIQIKDDSEIHELKYLVEGQQIKTESLPNNVELRNDDFKIEESKLKITMLQFELKMDSGDNVLKAEEISINDVKDDDSVKFEEYSEIDSDTVSLFNNNQGIRPQTSNECPSSDVPAGRTVIGRVGSSFIREFSVTKRQGEQLLPPRNNAFRVIEINDGFRCGLCSFQNQLEAKVEVHFNNYHNSTYKIENHLRVDLFSCSYCDYKTNHERNLEEHIKIHFSRAKHSIESAFYKCKYCDYETNDIDNFKLHIIKHSDGYKCYKCAQCDFKTEYKHSLKTHLIVHSDQSNFYKCEHCDFKTRHKYNLKTHLIMMHSDDSKFYKCAHCDFKTKNKYRLKMHLIMHSDENEFHKCEHCDYKTMLKCNLKRHLIVHSDESNFYKCDHCDFKTKHKHYIKTHLIVHSDESNFYKCEHCDYITKYKYHLKSHLIMHSDETKFYKCEHCDYKTKYRGNLKLHMIKHSDDFYKCAHCEFKTKQKYSLKTHLIVHCDDSKFYKCEHCDFKTKIKKRFKRHLTGHSDKSSF